MPALKNPKHERFAQGLLRGLTADTAYVEAGYKAHRGNASRLRADESIEKRLNELQKTVEKQVVEAVSVDRKWVIETLLRNARICMGDEKVTLQKTDKEGNVKTVEATMRDAAQANAALKLLGQLPEVGLFKEGGDGDKDGEQSGSMPQPTGQEHLRMLARRFGLRVVAPVEPDKKASGD